jgi:hypothetical protein
VRRDIYARQSPAAVLDYDEYVEQPARRLVPKTTVPICGTHIAFLSMGALPQGRRGEGGQNMDSGRWHFRPICAHVRPCDADGDANHLERRRPRQQQPHRRANGAAGGTSFTVTRATIAAGAGNRLVYSLPVRFASNLAAPQITDTVTASDPAASSVAVASVTNVLVVNNAAQAIPINDARALWLLICFILLSGGWRARARPKHLMVAEGCNRPGP